MKILFCLLVFCLSVSAVIASDLTVSELIQKNTEAIGGIKAIEATKSIEITVLIEEPEFTVKGIYKADRDQRMRIDIYQADKWVFAESYDGKQGWQFKEEKGQGEKSSDSGSAALQHGIILPGKLYGLHELSAMGHKLEIEGREKLDGIEFYVLKLTLKDGFTIFYYINPETWLIERSRDFKALHPDVDPSQKWFETRYSDFRKDGGVLRAYVSEKFDLKTGERAQTTTVQSIKINTAKFAGALRNILRSELLVA